MKKITLVMRLLGALLIGTTSCSKKETPVSPSAPAVTSLNSLFNDKGAPTQTFTINNNSVQTINGTHGTILTFNPGTFVTMSGAAVSGNVTIELREIYSKKDMLLSNVSTNAERYPSGPKEPLVSAGEVYIEASQGTSKLKMAPGHQFGLFLPSATTPNPAMASFTGKNTANGVLWTPNDSAAMNIPLVSPGYFCACDSLHWGNADCFMNSPNYTTINLNLTGTLNANDVHAYIWYDNVNTVWSFWQPFDPATSVYSDSHTATGIPIHIIVITVKDGVVYSSIFATTATAFATYNISLSATTEDALVAALSALP